MKICMVARTTLNHSSGGMQEDLHTLAEGAVKAGHRVVVITTHHPNGLRQIEAGRVEYYFLEAGVPESYEGGFFEKSYEKFQQLDRAIGFDVVYSQSISAAAFCDRVEVPLVTRFHGVWVGWRSSEGLYRWPVWRSLPWRERAVAIRDFPKEFLQGVRYRPLAERLYRTSTALVLDSEFSRELLLSSSPSIVRDKVRVIPLGIDTTRFSPVNKEGAKAHLGLDGPVLLFLSRLAITKGPRVALRAFESLDVPGTHLVIGGIGPELQWLQRYAAKRCINRVHFPGLIPEADRALYYSAADLFIYPELSDPAFGLVAAEAMACGTPVVGSEAGAIPEVVGDCGFLFPRGDVRALRNEIREALKIPTLLLDLSRRGRERIEAQFSQTRMVAAMAEAFEALLAREVR